VVNWPVKRKVGGEILRFFAAGIGSITTTRGALGAAGVSMFVLCSYRVYEHPASLVL
jgi:hypothetical protein